MVSSNRTRKQGAHIFKIESGKQDFTSGAPYYMYMNKEGKLKILGREGVTYIVARDGFFTGYYLGEDTHITYAQALEAANGRSVDLASVIRVFGDRLESNFALIYADITGKQVFEAHE